MNRLRKPLMLMLFLCVGAFAAACGDDGGGGGADGAALYASTPGGNNCSDCHGQTGMGDGPLAPSYDPAPTDLTTAISADRIETAIRNGYNDMPAYAGLSDEEVSALVDYVMSLSQ